MTARQQIARLLPLVLLVVLGAGITHRRAGAHLPGVHPARRDPRRRPPSRPATRGTWPAPARPTHHQQTPATAGESLANTARNTQAHDHPSRTNESVH
jgi:hypothetical protein